MNRPNPLTATPQDVKAQIEELCDRYDFAPSSSFAHTVLDDYNLDNNSIIFCSYAPNFIWNDEKRGWENDLSMTWRERWYEEAKKDLDEWELEDLDEMVKDIDELLQWLLKVPPEVRNECY